MSTNLTLARPYAKALFELARDAQALPAWSVALNLLGAVVRDVKVSRVLADPQWSGEQNVLFLLSLCGDSLTAVMKNVLKLLAENKRLLLLPAIAESFEHLKASSERRLEASVTSAIALSKETQEKLHQALCEKLLHDVELNFEVDAALMGGLVIRYEDVVIDASVRDQLNRLKTVLEER